MVQSEHFERSKVQSKRRSAEQFQAEQGQNEEVYEGAFKGESAEIH